MELFLYIIMMLLAVLLSNIINRFIPSISVPVVQVVLGVIIALLPLNYTLEVEPELFFTLFVGPLVYYGAMTANKRAMWSMKKPILNMALALVVLTSVVGGLLVHTMIPTISVAAAVTLIASLGPTDDVAVASVGKRYKVPGKLMELLQGESVFNDVSALILFQIGLSVIVSGTFSVGQSITQFFIASLGGLAAGAGLAFLQRLIMKWLYHIGVENDTVHVLLGVLMPFLIFYIAEALSVSGILAMFIAGIIYSFDRSKESPDTIHQSLTSDSIWSVLSFVLEGMVFVILGIQFPAIALALMNGSFPVGTGRLLLYMVLITLFLAFLRFMWALLTLPEASYAASDPPVNRWKAALIFALAGARGAVTLASVYSIPLVLDNGGVFPNRDMMIVLTMGVIFCSIILTYFVLPLLVKRKKAANANAVDNEVYLDILHHVVKELRQEATLENQLETEIVVRGYQDRIRELERRQESSPMKAQELSDLMSQMVEWECENVENLVAQQQISPTLGRYYLSLISQHTKRNRYKAGNKLLGLPEHFRIMFKLRRREGRGGKQFSSMMLLNDEYVLGKLHERERETGSATIREMILRQETSLAQKRRQETYAEKSGRVEASIAVKLKIKNRGLQLERDYIQNMFENGSINREVSRRMRNNVTLLEIRNE